MSTTPAPSGASLICLYGSYTPAAAARFEALAAATHGAGEAVLAGPAALRAELDALPHRFASQTVLDDPGPGSFAELANRASRQASGDYLVFLDEAFAPDPGWLELLLDPIDAGGADAATPRFARRGGSLLAAGCVVWTDGTLEPHGLGDNPNLPEYSFRRLVNCAPPWCLLVRRSAFEAAGGFDGSWLTPQYAVADVCFALLARAGTIAYQPRAIVREAAEGAIAESAAADLAADRARFETRWTAALADCPPHPPHEVDRERYRLAARDVLAPERMLLIDDRVPGHDRGSGDPRMLKMLLEIASLWPSLRLTFVALRPVDADRYAAPLYDAGIEVVYGRDWPSWLEQRKFHYGVVVVSRPQAVDELIRRTQPQAFRIYDAEALVFRRLERMAPFVADPDGAAAIGHQIKVVRAAEIDYLAGSDLIVCVTEEERRLARAVAERAPAFVIPHWAPAADAPPGFAERRDLVFFGGFMSGPGAPNEDALLHLAADVLPLVHEHEPDVVLHVVGADPTPAVLALHSDRINVVGYAADPTVWLNRARVHVVPMRFGSGVKLKLIDTMAAGLPFVTTAVGAEGLQLGPLRRITVAESAADLARLTLDLYRNEPLWTTTQARVLKVARRQFGRDRFRRTLVTVMSHAGVAPPQPPRGVPAGFDSP